MLSTLEVTTLVGGTSGLGALRDGVGTVAVFKSFGSIAMSKDDSYVLAVSFVASRPLPVLSVLTRIDAYAMHLSSPRFFVMFIAVRYRVLRSS